MCSTIFRNDCAPPHLEMTVSHQIEIQFKLRNSLEIAAPHLEMTVSHQIEMQFRKDCVPPNLEKF